jgi:hypothetical protein
MSVRVEHITSTAVEYITRNMRQTDIDEIKQGNGLTPRESIEHSIMLSDQSYIIRIGEIPVAIFGLVQEDKLLGAGVPWLLGTDDIDDYPFAFIRAVNGILKKMMLSSPGLMNYVHSKNKKSIRMLEHLGFKMVKDINIGQNNELFHEFRIGEF